MKGRHGFWGCCPKKGSNDCRLSKTEVPLPSMGGDRGGCRNLLILTTPSPRPSHQGRGVPYRLLPRPLRLQRFGQQPVFRAHHPRFLEKRWARKRGCCPNRCLQCMSNSGSAIDHQTRHSRNVSRRESGVFSLSIQPLETTQAAGFPPKCATGMTEWRRVQSPVCSMDMEGKALKPGLGNRPFIVPNQREFGNGKRWAR